MVHILVRNDKHENTYGTNSHSHDQCQDQPCDGAMEELQCSNETEATGSYQTKQIHGKAYASGSFEDIPRMDRLCRLVFVCEGPHDTDHDAHDECQDQPCICVVEEMYCGNEASGTKSWKNDAVYYKNEI